MGYTTSTVHGIEVPDSAEANNVPEDIGKVVTALEGGSLAKRLTGAQIAALTSPQKPAGLVVYNTTAGRLQISDGSAFADIAASIYVVGTRASNVTVTNNSLWTVTYTAESDPSAMLSSGIATLPVAGVWQISGSVIVGNLSGSDTELCQLEIMHGSTVAAKSTMTGTDVSSGSIPTLGVSASALIVASASDQVSLQFLGRTGSGMDHVCSAARFSAHLVSR